MNFAIFFLKPIKPLIPVALARLGAVKEAGGAATVAIVQGRLDFKFTSRNFKFVTLPINFFPMRPPVDLPVSGNNATTSSLPSWMTLAGQRPAGCILLTRRFANLNPCPPSVNIVNID
jgi:hypothetical protein